MQVPEVASQLQKHIALTVVGHAVQREQRADLTDLEHVRPVLRSLDLAERQAGYLLDMAQGEPALLAQGSQTAAEPIRTERGLDGSKPGHISPS
jgi:hypothetical protein